MALAKPDSSCLVDCRYSRHLKAVAGAFNSLAGFMGIFPHKNSLNVANAWAACSFDGPYGSSRVAAANWHPLIRKITDKTWAGTSKYVSGFMKWQLVQILHSVNKSVKQLNRSWLKNSPRHDLNGEAPGMLAESKNWSYPLCIQTPYSLDSLFFELHYADLNEQATCSEQTRAASKQMLTFLLFLFSECCRYSSMKVTFLHKSLAQNSLEVRLAKELPWRTPSCFREHSSFPETYPDPLAWNRETMLRAKALFPRKRLLFRNGWYFSNSVGAGHSVSKWDSIPTFTACAMMWINRLIILRNTLFFTKCFSVLTLSKATRKWARWISDPGPPLPHGRRFKILACWLGTGSHDLWKQRPVTISFIDKQKCWVHIKGPAEMPIAARNQPSLEFVKPRSTTGPCLGHGTRLGLDESNCRDFSKDSTWYRLTMLSVIFNASAGFSGTNGRGSLKLMNSQRAFKVSALDFNASELKHCAGRMQPKRQIMPKTEAASSGKERIESASFSAPL